MAYCLGNILKNTDDQTGIFQTRRTQTSEEQIHACPRLLLLSEGKHLK